MKGKKRSGTILGVVAACALLAGFCTNAFGAVSPAEMRGLLDRYGKEKLIRAVLALRENQITLLVNGEYRQFMGPPAPEFVTVDTLVRDVDRAGADAKRLEEILSSLSRLSSGPEGTAAAPARPASSAALKRAALECRIGKFASYMDQETRRRMRLLELVRGELEKAREQLYRSGRRSFGKRVQRSGDEIRFSIRRTDRRWERLLGPQWAALLRENPKKPLFFKIQASVNWEPECRVVQNFQACLEDRNFCRRTEVKDSALQMRQEHGQWRLTDLTDARQWGSALGMAEGMVKSVRWADLYLEEEKGQLSYDDLMLSLADGYFRRMRALLGKTPAGG